MPTPYTGVYLRFLRENVVAAVPSEPLCTPVFILDRLLRSAFSTINSSGGDGGDDRGVAKGAMEPCPLPPINRTA